MELKNLLIEINGNVATVTLNRPEKLNALNVATINELEFVFNSLQNNEEVSVIILTGSGQKAFAAGADVSEILVLDKLAAKNFSERGQEVFNLIENLGKPVIAAINGFALGGGCELALACHIRLASKNAKLGQPEINLGIIPGYGGTQRLARLINSSIALEYILTGDFIDAVQALNLGLVNHVFESDELIIKAEEIAEKIASKPAHAIKLILQAVNSTRNTKLIEGLKEEAHLFAAACETFDAKEGIKAFLEKRKPVFTNK